MSGGTPTSRSRRTLISLIPTLGLLVGTLMLVAVACGGGGDIPEGDEVPINAIGLPRLVDGELELWSGTMKTGAFVLGGANAYGYTTGVTLLGSPTGGPHGTLDDTSFSYRGMPHTIELMTYVKGIDNSDVFIVGFDESLLIWDVNMALYVNGHRLRHWSTSYLHGRIDTFSYVAGDIGSSLRQGQEVSLSLRKINLSGDSDLRSLRLSLGTLSPEFDAATTSYRATVGSEVTSVQVSAPASNFDAKVTVSSEVAGDSDNKVVALLEGENIVTVTVTAEDGTTNVYTITIIRESA